MLGTLRILSACICFSLVFMVVSLVLCADVTLSDFARCGLGLGGDEDRAAAFRQQKIDDVRDCQRCDDSEYDYGQHDVFPLVCGSVLWTLSTLGCRDLS